MRSQVYEYMILWSKGKERELIEKEKKIKKLDMILLDRVDHANFHKINLTKKEICW